MTSSYAERIKQPGEPEDGRPATLAQLPEPARPVLIPMAQATPQREWLAALPLFAGLPAEALDHLARETSSIHAARGDVVFRRGDSCRGLYVVTEGRIQVFLPDEGEGYCLLGSVACGGSLGEAALLLDVPHLASARAAEAATLLMVPAEAVLQAVRGAPDHAQRIHACASAKLRSLVHEVAVSAQKGADTRLAAYLLEQMESTHAAQVRLPDPKRAIAAQLLLAPETLSRSFGHLKAAGVIRMHGYSVEILDAAALRALAGR